MKSTTLIFPGQGSQYVGMGKEHMDTPAFKAVFEKANDTLRFDLQSICLEGPEEKLKLTEFTQPAILTHSIALFTLLKPILEEHNITIDRVLGHSVGEYPALVAAGALSFEDAVKAVHLRGKYMQEAVAPGEGKMYAILRIPGEIVQKACEEVSTESSKVMCANFNDPTQVVISGHALACDQAVEWLKNNYEGKQMAKELAVSAPFHSSLMAPAAIKLNDFLKTLKFSSNKIPYVANVDAREYSSGTFSETIKENLISQVCGSVLWTQSMSEIADESSFIEVGPGKVLSGLNKRINSTFNTYTLDKEDGLKNILEFLK